MNRLTRIAAALAAIALCMPAAAKEFRSSDVHPEDYPTVMAVKFMSDYIEAEDRRQGLDQGLHDEPARQREGHDRADQDRRARLRPASTSRR